MKHTVCSCVLMFILLSCTKDQGKLIVPATSCNTPDNVSFSKDILPIFNQYCATAGCHSGNFPQSNLNLEVSVAYQQLKNPMSGYIDTVNPNYSLLYAQMNSASQPMPPTGKLDPCKLNLVLKWIQQKAKNN